MKQIKKSVKRPSTAFAAIGAIGVAVLLYSGVNTFATNAAMSEQRDVPTTYSGLGIAANSAQSNVKQLNSSTATRVFTVTDNPLEYYGDKNPTANDITREQAADVGMTELAKVFGLDLTGKTVAMGYHPAENGMRATWSGEVLVHGDWKTGEGYSFSIDSVTGELHQIQHLRTLSANVSLDYDSKIAQDSTAYQTLARNAAEQYSLVGGKVKSAAYAGQGYQNNDPEVMIQVVGENGQRAQLQFSRYDKAFLSVMYQPALDEVDVMIRQAAQWESEIEDRAKEFFTINPDAQLYTEEH